MNRNIVVSGVALLSALVLATLDSRWQAEAFFVLLVVAARLRAGVDPRWRVGRGDIEQTHSGVRCGVAGRDGRGRGARRAPAGRGVRRAAGGGVDRLRRCAAIDRPACWSPPGPAGGSPRSGRVPDPGRRLAPRSAGRGAAGLGRRLPLRLGRAASAARPQPPRSGPGQPRPRPSPHGSHAPDRSDERGAPVHLPAAGPALLSRRDVGARIRAGDDGGGAGLRPVDRRRDLALARRDRSQPLVGAGLRLAPSGRAGGGGRGPCRRRRRAAARCRGLRAVSAPFAPGRGRSRRRPWPSSSCRSCWRPCSGGGSGLSTPRPARCCLCCCTCRSSTAGSFPPVPSGPTWRSGGSTARCSGGWRRGPAPRRRLRWPSRGGWRRPCMRGGRATATTRRPGPGRWRPPSCCCRRSTRGISSG